MGRLSTTECTYLPTYWIIRRQVSARCPGLDHPGRNKQEKPPPPGLDQAAG